MNAGTVTNLYVLVYVLSGVSQPLLMTVCKNAGLADSKAQLYMLFYYAGPTFLLLTLLPPGFCSVATTGKPKVDTSATTSNNSDDEDDDGDDDEHRIRPSTKAVFKACLIALFDIMAQSLNYTGAGLAGATIFAVVYSSVTVWTAVFSRLLLGRGLDPRRWGAVFLVFGGLCLAAADGRRLGDRIARGTALVLVGSCMHGATYVMSEALMKGASGGGGDNGAAAAPDAGDRRERLSVRENAAIQGLVAFAGLLGWQFVYTAKRWDEVIREPMEAAGTTLFQAGLILGAFALANLLHSFSFYHTLANYPGGSTSAGVMKGLQAVLVFVVAHLIFCGNAGGEGMCFSFPKFLSLVTVVGGVMLFGASTEHGGSEGYTQVGSMEVVEETLTV